MTETSAAAGSWQETLADERTQPFPWWAFLVTGCLGVVFGAAVLAWPDVTLRIMALLAGFWLLAGGIVRILAAFLPGGPGFAHRVLSGIVGVIVLIAGLVCLRQLATRLAVLALMFAISWTLAGVAALIMGFQYRGAVRAGLIVVGALALIAGCVLVVTPTLSLTTLVLVTGAGSIVVGTGEVIMAFVVRRIQR